MKSVASLLLLLSLYGGFAAQTVKTPEGREVAALDRELQVLKLEVAGPKEKLQLLLQKYTEEYREVVSMKAAIEEVEARIRALENRRQTLLRARQSSPVPSDTAGLLRTIVIQNERLLDLMEHLVRLTSRSQ